MVRTLDRYGAHTYYAWLETFNLLYLVEEGGYFAAGLGPWLGHFKRWDPYLARLSQQKL
jgi:hypothetical protein